MKRSYAAALLSLFVAPATGLAADLGAMPMSEPMSQAPGSFVEVGSNWYIRGDLGFSFDTAPTLTYPNILTPPPAGVANVPNPAGYGPSTDQHGFNAGLMAIDRARWSGEELGERAMRALLTDPGRYPYMEQSALNELIAGRFAPLSPRYNFMGDFFLLDLEARIDPVVLHFVNRPKPWERDWRGEARFSGAYRAWFAASPWPDRPARR